LRVVAMKSVSRQLNLQGIYIDVPTRKEHRERMYMAITGKK